MPALLTHHIFGEDAVAELPDNLIGGQEELLAFLLGNQGPDPFWARFSCSPRLAHTLHWLASRMHTEHVGAALLSLRKGVGDLRAQDRGVGRAFVLGMAAHYVLDSVAHPLILALQQQLEKADPSLETARREVHALLEADLDAWLLMERRQQTVAEAPAANALARTPRVDRVAGYLLARTVREVYGCKISMLEYPSSVRNMSLLYKLIDSPHPQLPGFLLGVERCVRAQMPLAAHAHRTEGFETCLAANLERRNWKNETTGETSQASFPDLYHDALMAWPEFSRRVAQGDKSRLETMIAHVDYYGRVRER